MQLINHEPADDDYTGPWCHTEIECDVCGQVQMSVYPLVCMPLECGGCGTMMPAPIVAGEVAGFTVIVLPFRDKAQALRAGLDCAAWMLGREDELDAD
jgi:hypothetical protein